MDPRVKMPILVLTCAAAFAVLPAGLAPTAGFALLLWLLSGLGVSVIGGGGKGIGFLLLLIVAGLSLSTPGETLPDSLDERSGFRGGTPAVGAHAPPHPLRNPVRINHPRRRTAGRDRLVSLPIPLSPGKRVAITISLVIRLIPLVADEYAGLREAELSRCADNSRRPVRRIVRMAVPLLLRTLERGSELVTAMESRCFEEERSLRNLTARPADWAALVPGIGIPVLL
jgi:energy-coupling factor transporter transmembrane protein EcfT